MKINFTSSQSAEWYVVNDGVMGGMSEGSLERTDDGLMFSGSVSLENNGGFASFRGPWNSYDLAQYEEVQIRYRSKGMRFSFVLETDRRYYMPNYKVSLNESDEWKTAAFSLKEFGQYRLGAPTGEKLLQSDMEEIIRIGFITSEKRESDYMFEVSTVAFK